MLAAATARERRPTTSRAAAAGRPPRTAAQYHTKRYSHWRCAARGGGRGGARVGVGGGGAWREGGLREKTLPTSGRGPGGRRGGGSARVFFFPGSRLGWGRRLRGSTCPLALKAHFTWIHSREGGGRSPSNSRERRAALQVSRVAEGRGKGKVSRVCHHEGRAGTSERERSGARTHGAPGILDTCT